MTDEPIAPTRVFLPELLMTLLLRGVALACLWFAIEIWGDLIGYSEGGALRFDLLGPDMKAAYSSLAVLYPVAAVGLWLRGSWGPVIWTITAIVEFSMHEVYWEIFGTDTMRMIMIASIALFYLALRLVIHFRKPDPAAPAYP